MATYTSGNSIKQELKDYNLSTLLPVTTLDQIYNTWDDTSHQDADDKTGVDLINYYTWQFLGTSDSVPAQGITSENLYSIVVVRTPATGIEPEFARITLSPTASNQIICADGTFKSISDFINITAGTGVDITQDSGTGYQVISLDVSTSLDGSVGGATPIVLEAPAADSAINTLNISLGGRMATFGKALFEASLDSNQYVALFTESGVTFNTISSIFSNISAGRGLEMNNSTIQVRQPSVTTTGSSFSLGFTGEATTDALMLTVPTNVEKLAAASLESSAGYLYYDGNAFASKTIEQVEQEIGFDVSVNTVTQYFLTGINTSQAEGTTIKSNDASWGVSTAVYTENGGLYQTSDATLKTFTDTVDIDFEKLATISKSKFYWKDDETKHINIGVSAQEVQKVYPELVSKDNVTGKLSVSYDKLSVIALAAIDKLAERLDLIEEKLDALLKK